MIERNNKFLVVASMQRFRLVVYTERNERFFLLNTWDAILLCVKDHVQIHTYFMVFSFNGRSNRPEK